MVRTKQVNRDIRVSKQRLLDVIKMAELCVFQIDFRNPGCVLIENPEVIFKEGEALLQALRITKQMNKKDYCMSVLRLFVSELELRKLEGLVESVLEGEETVCEVQCGTFKTAPKWCRLALKPVMRNNRIIRIEGVLKNIHALKEQMKLLEEAAKRETFTGLYNKKSSEVLIRAAFNDIQSRQQALLIIDLDCFKEINDTYGHAVGDEVILEIANYLKGAFRKTDIVGRFGGDEYIVLMRELPPMHLLESKLSEIVSGNNNRYGVTKSIGVAIYPDMGRDFETIFRKADQALYESKIKRGTYTIYHASRIKNRD